MRRWKPAMPRYRTPCIVQQVLEGPASTTGRQARGTDYARVLRAYDFYPATGRVIDVVSDARLTLPSTAPPANHLAEPTGNYQGWAAWWPVPPDTNQNEYQIPNPPRIGRTANPTADLPVLYEAKGSVGGTWINDVMVSAIFVLADWNPKVGKELEDGVEITNLNYASVKVRPGAIESIGINAKEWELVDVDTGTTWDIQYLKGSYRRGEYIDMLVQEKQ